MIVRDQLATGAVRHLRSTEAISAAPADDSLSVAIWSRNRVELHGLESIARQLEYVVFGSHKALHTAIETARQASGLLVVPLRDIGDRERSQLGSATAAGTRLLVMVDDVVVDLTPLQGIRCSGIVRSSSVDKCYFESVIGRILGGEMPIPSDLARHLVEVASGEPGTAPGQVRLTPREMETLSLMTEGLSNQQVANRLGVSAHGAKRLVANILAKLDCSNRTSAVARAIQDGLCEPPD